MRHIRIAWFLALAAAAAAAWAQDRSAPPQVPLSKARAAGDTLYVSGQIPRKPDGSEVRESVAAETAQVMENIGRVLKEHGYGFDDIVSATVYLRNLDDYQEMNKAYGPFFKSGKYPSRACIGGLDIVLGFRVEISCIAYKEGAGKKRGKNDF